MIAMRHFSLSSGSACSSGEKGPSPVLAAIGVSETEAYSSIRFGLGSGNTQEIEIRVDLASCQGEDNIAVETGMRRAKRHADAVSSALGDSR